MKIGLCGFGVVGRGVYEITETREDTQATQGLWLEDDGYREVYYKDGVVDGIFRSYSRKTGTLLSIGWYCKGMLSGRWFYFDEQGKLLRIDDHPDLEGSPVWLANSYLSK